VIRETLVFPDPEATCRALGAGVVEAAREVLERSDRFSLVLPGGHTPQALFRRLAGEFRSRLDWSRVHLFWTDERAVGPDDPASNFGLARRTLLGPLGLPGPSVHRIRGEDRPLERAAQEYEEDLRQYFGPGSGAALPATTFDFVVLGVGPDGHTASLFPSSPTGNRPDRWVVATPRAPLPPRVERVTLTLPMLNRSREVAFLACGPDKRAIVRRILEGPPRGPGGPPAARVEAFDRLRWFLDAAAAGSPP
jgi:6-phosphogluconolactonase